jgi:hypothetical protein
MVNRGRRGNWWIFYWLRISSGDASKSDENQITKR